MGERHRHGYLGILRTACELLALNGKFDEVTPALDPYVKYQ